MLFGCRQMRQTSRSTSPRILLTVGRRREAFALLPPLNAVPLEMTLASSSCLHTYAEMPRLGRRCPIAASSLLHLNRDNNILEAPVSQFISGSEGREQLHVPHLSRCWPIVQTPLSPADPYMLSTSRICTRGVRRGR